MCQTIHLYHSNKGFVVYCKICKHLQIGFGNIAMSFGISEYERFAHSIAQTCPKYCSKCFSRNIWIPIESQKVCLLLSGKEIHELNEILSIASNSLELIKLLKDLHKNQIN
jgi:hypothetical protein